jgi:predicted TIM-barrel fold metal-dependent hydrolase
VDSTKSHRIIALEEHYFDAELVSHYSLRETQVAQKKLRAKLDDLDEKRLAAMDVAGIDLQVLSHGVPGTHRLEADVAVPLASRVNGGLHDAVQRHPDRLAAFATLPATDPAAAAAELDRCVSSYDFKGAMVHGLTQGLFIDDRRFWPIFERAQALDVPMYLHPSLPHPPVIDAYYKDYVDRFPALLHAGWGFTVETATQAIRLVLSGVFDAYPNLKIILGHLGESIPFSLWRINQTLSRSGNDALNFKEIFRKHFYITTSGNFSDSALNCSIAEMGIDHVLFSVD